MGAKREPTARQMRLATELRRLRDAAGLSARETATRLGVNSVQISQIEYGTSGVSEQRLRRMAAIYGCSDTRLIDALVGMATDRTPGWWEADRGQLATPFLDLAELEHHASYRWDVDFIHVPGLLQTEAYAHALFSYINPEFPESEIDRWVEHRMKRRTIIERAEPIPYKALVHEAALRIRVGDRASARRQLSFTLEVAEAPHITLRVIPFDLDHFGGAGSAMLYAGSPVPKLDTVVRDTPQGVVHLDAEAQLSHFRALFRRLEEASLAPEESRDFIHKLTKEL
ncbi:helix-turn-helix domain-containing protein [Streptomyces sp. NPDC059477]|uniref:helix-turn-helix domain-containing protein n=1 Tax=Streptomyces sp. NPDC059477 TaxID=3346847 RepID=UPI00367FC8A5